MQIIYTSTWFVGPLGSTEELKPLTLHGEPYFDPWWTKVGVGGGVLDDVDMQLRLSGDDVWGSDVWRKLFRSPLPTELIPPRMMFACQDFDNAYRWTFRQVSITWSWDRPTMGVLMLESPAPVWIGDEEDEDAIDGPANYEQPAAWVRCP